MKGILLSIMSALLVAMISSCGGSSKGIEGKWIRINDGNQGTIVKVEDSRGKVSYAAGGLKTSFNVGDVKFKNIKKNKDGTYTAGDLYKGSDGSKYKDVEITVDGDIMYVVLSTDHKNVKTYARVKEDIKSYSSIEDGDTSKFNILPYGYIEFDDGSSSDVYQSTYIDGKYFLVDGYDYIMLVPNHDKKNGDKLFIVMDGDTVKVDAVK